MLLYNSSARLIYNFTNCATSKPKEMAGPHYSIHLGCLPDSQWTHTFSCECSASVPVASIDCTNIRRYHGLILKFFIQSCCPKLPKTTSSHHWLDLDCIQRLLELGMKNSAHMTRREDKALLALILSGFPLGLFQRALCPLGLPQNHIWFHLKATVFLTPTWTQDRYLKCDLNWFHD